MANLNLDPSEVTILLTGFSVAHKMFRGNGNVYDAISKFALAISVYNQDTLPNLLMKLNQLAKESIKDEPTKL